VILVDSSVWIDYLRGTETPQVEVLEGLLGGSSLAIGDLILAEVLQGISNEKEFNQVRKMLEAFTQVELGGHDIAVKASKNHRALRSKGLTVRKTIDTFIATRCIENGLTLLHSDRDFLPFEEHLGLKVAYSET
jgi:predicted nucleic acid-binding protein